MTLYRVNEKSVIERKILFICTLAQRSGLLLYDLGFILFRVRWMTFGTEAAEKFDAFMRI